MAVHIVIVHKEGNYPHRYWAGVCTCGETAEDVDEQRVRDAMEPCRRNGPGNRAQLPQGGQTPASPGNAAESTVTTTQRGSEGHDG